MGFLDKVEKSIEGAVSGVFARAFRGEVEPVEIAGRLQRELDSEAQILSRDKSLVPNDFVVRLSSRDYERLVPYTKTLNAEIIPTLRDHASERHYVFNGPIHIRYDLDDTLPVGKFTVLTRGKPRKGRLRSACTARAGSRRGAPSPHPSGTDDWPWV